jgi:hypothetical protein
MGGKKAVPWRLRRRDFFSDRRERGWGRLEWSYLGKHAARDTGKSGHRRGGFRDRSPDAERGKFPGPLPIPPGEDSLLLRPSGKTDLSLFWMRGGGVGLPFSNEGPKPGVCRGGRGSRRPLQSSDPVREGCTPGAAAGGPLPHSPGRLRNVPRTSEVVPRREGGPGFPPKERHNAGCRTGILPRLRGERKGPP